MSNLFSRTVGEALASFAAVFEPAPGSQSRQTWEIPVLCALLVIAAVLRFWGLGDYGLHKPDEDTTVLAAVHILQDGLPRFPSGMLYTRAMLQSYLIAGSILLFGENEWAMRLPSVLCGLLLVVLAWRVGRRFLTPVWSMVLAAVITALPGMLADSQEARMYIFLLVALALFALAVFAWERSNRVGWLLGAILIMVCAIQIQQLAIFGSLLLFFPGLVRGDTRRFYAACAAFAPVVLYFVYVRWTPSPYPEVTGDYAHAVPLLGEVPSAQGLRLQGTFVVAALLAGAGSAWLSLRGMVAGRARGIVAALLLVGFVALAALYYHVGMLLILAGVLFAARHSASRRWSLLLVLVVAAMFAVAQLAQLREAGAGDGSLRKLLGIIVGRPSVWPYIMTVGYSPVAFVLLVAGGAYAVARFTSRRALPEVWLFFLLTVWLPLFGMGLTGWYFPARYVEFALLPLLLTALASAQQLLAGRLVGAPASVLAAMLGIAMVNPPAVARAFNPALSFPDHRAAAGFVRNVHPGPRDIVIVEEVLIHTYYLGKVDYWLVDRSVAANFVQRVGGRPVDQYTHTEILGSVADLESVIARPGRGAIYIIGSGEGAATEGRKLLRGESIHALLEHDPRLKTVFVARDGATRVWKIDAPAAGPG